MPWLFSPGHTTHGLSLVSFSFSFCLFLFFSFSSPSFIKWHPLARTHARTIEYNRHSPSGMVATTSLSMAAAQSPDWKKGINHCDRRSRRRYRSSSPRWRLCYDHWWMVPMNGSVVGDIRLLTVLLVVQWGIFTLWLQPIRWRGGRRRRFLLGILITLPFA